VPEPRDRDAFLAHVSAGLDLPESLARDVLEELAGHLDEAAAELRSQGISAEDADRRAISRLGDPRVLGRGLSSAHQGRRQLLAAAGGGIRAVLVEGIRAYLFLGLSFALAAAFVIPIASSLLHLAGTSTSSYFGGPLGSCVTVFAVLGGSAYLGWVLPARIATPALRSVRGVRRTVSAIGFGIGSAVVWLLLPLTLDPVLAVGLPLAPVAFAVAALRAPETPTFRVGYIPAVILVAALILPMTLVALATATPSQQGGWEADWSAVGDAPAADSLENTVAIASWSMGVPGDISVAMDLGDAAPVLMARYPMLSVETWPAVDVGERILLGPSPLVATRVPTRPSTIIDWSLPHLRDSVTTASFVVGVTRDARRVVLAQDFSLYPTPAWKGTVADWWLGR
jgi:hypothetical protein